MLRKILLHLKTYGKWYILFALSVCSVIVWSVVVHEQRNGVLSVSFLDIGQGNATFIESPTGTQVIIDGGPNKNLMREVPSVIPWYDRNIDMLIVSHPDKDHYEGFISLLDRYSVDVFMEPGISDTSGEYNFLKQKIISNKIPVVLARRGQIIDIGGGAYIEILFPDRDVFGLETNNASIVSRLVYGDTSLIIQGDSPQVIENYLVGLDKDILDSDIIEVGHHGSKTSSSEMYIEAVSPQYAVISVGKDNTYGHPNKETLDVLNKNKVEILRTDELGRITFKSDGDDFVLKK